MVDEEKPRPAADQADDERDDDTDEEEPEEAEEAAPAPAEATPKKQAGRAKAPPARARARAAGAKATAGAPKAPRRPQLDAETTRLLRVRDATDARRPIFGRQSANRRWRIGRWGNWRRPRGLQSKQRRHYGYRAEVVSIGYATPARVRHLTPTGFRPAPVATTRDLEGLDAKRDAAVIGRTVGTRRRLVLEETARKKGIHVLNPLLKEREEE